MLVPSLVAPSRSAALEPEIGSKLKKLFAELEGENDGVQRGVAVVDLEQGEAIFSSNPGTLLTPASAMKLVPTIVALKLLGGTYRFPTEIFVDTLPKEIQAEGSGNSFVEQSTSIGNMYVRGYGDPTMSSERLSDLAEAVVQQGITEVGDLVLDDELFVDAARPTGQNPYEAGLSATSVNNNTYAVYVSPGPPGKPAVVTLTAGVKFELVNRVTTVRGTADNLQIVQLPPSGSIVPKPAPGSPIPPQKVRVTVSGSIGYDNEPIVMYQAVPDPTLYFGTLLAHYLERAGVKVRGAIRLGETPGSAKLLELLESDELTVILQRLNHTSSNFIAGQLLYILGQESSGYFRYQQGLRRIYTALGELGIDPTSLTIVDGSGLDRGNKLSAEQLTKLLYAAYKNFAIAPDLIASLSRFGKSGTLRYRPILDEAELKQLRGEELRSTKARALSIWAKTGTLEGVSALAGYVETRSGRRLAFTILQNGKRTKEQLARVEDQFVSILAGLPEQGQDQSESARAQ